LKSDTAGFRSSWIAYGSAGVDAEPAAFDAYAATSDEYYWPSLLDLRSWIRRTALNRAMAGIDAFADDTSRHT
jgi:hypothetical protein